MSETESYKSPEFDEFDEYEQEVFVNERYDRYSENSSDVYVAQQADPSSSNKKYVMRVNPATKKLTRVYFFATSSTPNSIIKNAMTGTFQSDEAGRYYRVGSRDEDLFFSTILATGEMGQTGPILFYDSPEQYERHFFTKLPEKIKDRWNEKRNLALYFAKQNKEHVRGGGEVVVK